MLTRVYLGGVGLHEISRDVLVTAVSEGAPATQRQTMARGSRVGQWVSDEARSYLEIAVCFALRNRRDTQKRAETLERVCAWAAGGGILTVSYRPERQLRVVCEALPEAGSMREWTSEYELRLRAYDVPYWEDEREAVCTVRASGHEGVLVRRGTACTPASFAARNAGSGTVQALEIAVGDSHMAFANLALASGETLCLDDAQDGTQRIRIIGTDGAARDAYACRTPASSDALLLRGERETLLIRCDSEMDWTIRHRGRYA